MVLCRSVESSYSKYYFSDFDKWTLKRPLNEETYAYIVCRLVDDLWLKRNYWRRHIKDDDSQWQYIEALRSRYKYPDYLELVGPPEATHYEEDGQLTIQRKSTLLLVGVFDWRGLKIAKHQAKFGFNPMHHYWDDERRYSRDQRGWYFPLARNRPEAKSLTVRDYFSPLRSFRCQRLEEYLTPIKKYCRVTLRDRNPYNCHPDNVEVSSTRGRPMRCAGCEKRVTAVTSKRVRFSGDMMRYCLKCLADLGIRGADDSGRLL